jgi:hypothetical protein
MKYTLAMHNAYKDFMGYNFKPACGLTLYTVKSQGGLHLYYLQHAELVLNLIATEIIYNPA